MSLTYPRNTLGRAGSRIHPVAGIVKAGYVIVEKILDTLLAVARHEQRLRIPIDQYIAEIKDDVGDRLPGMSRSGVIGDHFIERYIQLRFSRPTLHRVSFHEIHETY